ncbi:MAG TPA: ATP-binding protein [Kofleriaceae bacterium]|nr:ATP-binding protein [Kofleriaceae bacterium]
MNHLDTIRLLDALADVHARKDVSLQLARHFGAEAMFIFVPDPDRPTKLLPAAGARMVPAMRGWAPLLAACVTPGIHSGLVAYPDARSDAPACGYAFPGLTFVLVGCAGADERVKEHLSLAPKLLSLVFRAEAELATARGEVAIERQSSERTAALAKALDRARGDAERATRVKDEFLAMLGHELRNPLAPIMTALHMMRMDGVHTRAQDVLERQVAHVLRLVDDLLDVSRITSGKVELRVEPIEIEVTIQRALEMSRPLLEQKRNRVVLDVAERGLLVDGDPARLAQIFANLVTNASKYSDPDTTIHVRAECEAEMVRVVVADQGIGIDPAYAERIFEQFVQVPQGVDRSAGGLGLGLAIVRSLVAKHGGTVRCTSNGRGRGSTFIVELPLGCATTVLAPVAVSSPSRPPADRAKLLLVDDNTDAAELLAEVLTSHGHEVYVASSGPEALMGVSSFKPDAALLDIGLPVMDGFELAKELRSRLPLLKLIAITGYGQANDRERTRAAGFHAHLVKPVSIANVTRTISDLLTDPS